ncbi:MAG: hypothetical protein RL885_11420 [Planctomycetota bacterium]
MSKEEPRSFANLVELPDFISPLTIKELRQGTRAHSAFSFCFGTLLLGTVILFLVQWRDQSESSGSTVLGLLWILGFCVNVLLIPTLALQSVTREIESGTHELLLLTGASGWNLSVGKIASPLALAIVNLILILPFATFAYFQRGVSLEDIFFIELELLLLSTFAITGAIFLGCIGLHRTTRWMARIGAGIFGLFFAGYYLGRGFNLMRFGEETSPWLNIAPTLILTVSCVPVFLAAAQGRLGRTGSFDTPQLRLVAVLVQQVLLGVLIWSSQYHLVSLSPRSESLVLVTSCLIVAHFVLAALCFCCGPLEPAKRSIAVFPARVSRALLLGPGVHRGMLLCLAMAGETLFVLMLLGNSRPTGSVHLSFGILLSIFFLVGNPLWAAILGLLGGRRVAPVAGILFGLLVNWIAILLAAVSPQADPSPIGMLSPFTNDLDQGGDLSWPGFAALFVVFAALLRLIRTERETRERSRLRQELARPSTEAAS